MLGGPSTDDAEMSKRMADLQVKSSFIQFIISVGLINLAPYVIEAVMGEKMSLSKVPVHKCLEKLQWLLGVWRSESATIQLEGKSFAYLSELKCEHVGQPNFILHINAFNVQPLPNSDPLSTWSNAKELKPFHREMGFLRVNPNDEASTNISYLNVQNVGLANVEEGDINGQSFVVKTQSIGRSCFNKDPSVRLLRREYLLDEKDSNILSVKVFMSTSRMDDNEQPFEHLTIQYRKVSNE
ncbi:unnamed protein product [Rotaria socialis]|uniref:THAP4-like heme-binding domain-containing protein n=1 Tax=Rotaria socialis TaxID=392032 RepID=A0A820T295_9BILA|nr:unnamed protein product [Rotaria socialis]CAF3399776.1 unnamed protein product [Rotaria socialis]CAF3654724.1 unnamed protein product [Rotaria socialis]CAF3675154.1 unnamed protein product [Rotaria socialis]CAF4282161.1 unnamed protein product [Rotaria socialis]